MVNEMLPRLRHAFAESLEITGRTSARAGHRAAQIVRSGQPRDDFLPAGSAQCAAFGRPLDDGGNDGAFEHAECLTPDIVKIG